jgi:hypothetical protein
MSNKKISYRNFKPESYRFKVSKRKNKKYDVYQIVDGELKYITSFGDKRYQHYEDKISDHYSHLNHYDEERRRLYRLRHKNDHIGNPNYAGFWSYHYLW